MSKPPANVERVEEPIRLDCEGVFGHHSNDRVTVWYGRTTPARVCGRHHAYALPEVLERINK